MLRTITLEPDAFERLEQAKRSPHESFSSVVRRAEFTEENPTIKDLISFMRNRAAKGPEFLSEAALDSLDAAQDNPMHSDSKWNDSL